MNNRNFFIGKILTVEENLTAEIEIDGMSIKDCRFIGLHSSTIQVDSEVLVIRLSESLFLYQLLTLETFVGLSYGDTKVELLEDK